MRPLTLGYRIFFALAAGFFAYGYVGGIAAYPRFALTWAIVCALLSLLPNDPA